MSRTSITSASSSSSFPTFCHLSTPVLIIQVYQRVEGERVTSGGGRGGGGEGEG